MKDTLSSSIMLTEKSSLCEGIVAYCAVKDFLIKMTLFLCKVGHSALQPRKKLFIFSLNHALSDARNESDM